MPRRCGPGDRRRRYRGRFMSARDDAAPADWCLCLTDDGRAKAGISPDGAHGAGRCVRRDGNRTGRECRLQTRPACGGIGHRVEAAGRRNTAPTQPGQGVSPVQLADECHVDEALGGEIHFALPQRLFADVVDEGHGKAGLALRHEGHAAVDGPLSDFGDPIRMKCRRRAKARRVVHGCLLVC